MDYLRTWYERALLAPALVPLFYIQGTMYPLMAPKTLLLRALGVLTLALFVYLVAVGELFYVRRLRHWTSWIPAALLVVAYLASFLGVDFYRSFWSTFERGDGLLTLTVAVGYFYLILLSVERVWLTKLCTWIAWAASFAAVYLIAQWVVVVSGIYLPFIVPSNGRVGGTMGNAAFMASYLGMTVLATIAVARMRTGRMQALLYAGAVLQIAAVILTATRATLLALALVVFAALVTLAVKGQGILRVRARGGLAVLLILAALFIGFRNTLSHSPFEPIRRIATISFTDTTIASRLFIWNNVSREALSHPFFGYGAEHIATSFDRVYDPSIIVEEWFDRSHNAYLDYFVQFGMFGLACYLLLIGSFLAAGVRLVQARDPFGYVLLGTGAVYAIQNFFVFDTGVTLWLLFAFIAATAAYEARENDATLFFTVRRPVLGAFCAILIADLVIPVAIWPLRANLLAFEAYQYQIVDVQRSNAAAEKALALGTYADLELGYNAYFMYTEEQIQRLSEADLDAAYQHAARLLARNFRRYPYDARTAVYLAQVLASAPSGMTLDHGLFSETLAKSISLSPKRAEPWYLLANLSIGEANTHPARSSERIAGYAAAKDIIEKYIALVPGLAEPYFILAQLEYAGGDTAAASRYAAEGKALYRGGLGSARRAVSYYGTVQDLPNLEYFLSVVVSEVPMDYAYAYDLAKVKFLLGSKDAATEIVAELRANSPAILDTDPNFLNAITAYERSKQ